MEVAERAYETFLWFLLPVELNFQTEMAISLGLLLMTEASTYIYAKELANFDYFELTVSYPKSICRAFNKHNGSKSSCKVPINASPWTIHGLWPDRNDGTFPEFCDHSNKFVLSKILPIREKLERNWPNLFVMRSISSLWKHEWEKHGTCAATVDEVDDEVKYFNKSLVLYERFDIFNTLKKHEFIPSEEKVYDRVSLHQILKSAYGVNIDFHCLQDQETENSLLADVRLCLTKNFHLMDCKERAWKWNSRLTHHPCPANGIVYPSFNNAHSFHGNVILAVSFMLYSF